MTEITQKRKKHFKIANLFHFLLQYGPILVFLGLVLVNLESPVEAFSFFSIFLIGLVLSVIAVAKNKLSRSSLWIILIAMYLVLDYILAPLVVIAACQILDEIICVPITDRLKEKYHNGKDVEEYLK